MATIEIKRRSPNIPVAILSAGISNKMKSYEPRSLLKINDEPIIEKQIKSIRSAIDGDILLVIGFKANKVIRKVAGFQNVRVIENQLYETTNAAESIRLSVNNNPYERLLVMHGDIVFNTETLKSLSYNKSFIIVDNAGSMNDREVGVNILGQHASNLSYDLPTKWGQIAYFCGKEYQHLKALCRKDTQDISHKLFFELVNLIIDRGGTFLCHEPAKMKIFEIDSMNDLYENTNS